MTAILEDVLVSLKNHFSQWPVYQEPYLLDEYALLQTSSLLAPTLFRQYAPDLADLIVPFAEETTSLYAIRLCLDAWGCDSKIISSGDLKYRDHYASPENSPGGRARAEHQLWYSGMYGEAE